jgi:hypothetical protein
MIKVKLLENGCCPYIDGYLPGQTKNPDNDADCWDFYSEEYLAPIIKELPGQHRFTGLGKSIFETASESNGPRKWVEVGAWNGNGTTLCLLDGCMARRNKDDLEIWSYEADPILYPIARENLENHPFYENCFFLKYGRIPGTEEFPPEYKIPDSEKQVGGHYHLNYERERAIYTLSEQIQPPFLPEAIILDGGEYTGYFDWLGIEKSSLQYIFLDDVNIMKHKKVYEELLSNPEWSLFKEDKHELNGWAIFKKV